MATGNTSKDGTGDYWSLLVDSDGRQEIVGPAAEDAAAAGNPVLLGGRYDAVARTLDAGDVGAIALDASGRVITVNTAQTEGEAVSGGPSLVGGRYDAAARTLTDGDAGAVALDVAGRIMTVGVAAEDAAAAGNPLLIGGRYDTAARSLDNGDIGAVALDVASRTIVVGAAAEDAAVAGDPVLIGGRYDSSARTLETGDVGAPALDVAGRLLTTENGKVGHSITLLAADGNIKATAGVLYALVITGIGVTAGDTVDIEDDTTDKIKFVFAAANETITFTPSVPISFATSIHVDLTISGGTIAVSGVYD